MFEDIAEDVTDNDKHHGWERRGGNCRNPSFLLSEGSRECAECSVCSVLHGCRIAPTHHQQCLLQSAAPGKSQPCCRGVSTQSVRLLPALPFPIGYKCWERCLRSTSSVCAAFRLLLDWRMFINGNLWWREGRRLFAF